MGTELSALAVNPRARDSRLAHGPGAISALASMVLTLTLATTTPVGTGAGLHQFELLHTLFGHVHLVNGRVVAHDGFSEAVSRHPLGTALGASNGGDAADGTLGLSPTVPAHGVRLFVNRAAPAWRAMVELPAPQGRVDTPPDPPPTFAA